MKFRDCVGVFHFNAAHYTPVGDSLLLHGHTFGVEVCVSGSLDVSRYWVVDFLKVKNLIKGLVEFLDYSLLIPTSDLGKVRFEGPFKTRLVSLDCSSITAECIAKYVCNEVTKSLTNGGYEFMVKVFEGVDSYVELLC